MTDAALPTGYAGRRGRMFWLATRTGILTVLTLGLYRFWMKSRMRRYYWSAIRPGGVPAEYVGLPTEKLQGFLTAVVVLAFYIGIVNLILMFISFSLAGNDLSAYLLSFLGLVPLIFFAQYRARRYVLARTRWRGIRFGLDPGVWGFVWRSGVHWLVTIVTAGLLYPRQVFALEKYRTDRTWYGDHKFEQTGRWQALVGAMKHIYIGVGLIAAATGLAIVLAQPAIGALGVVGVIWALVGLAYWKAERFKRLTEGKRLGPMGFRSTPSTGTLIGIYLGGSAAISGILTGFMIVAGIVIAALAALISPDLLEAGLEDAGALAQAPIWLSIVVGIASYFALFLLFGTLREAFITLPVAKHLAETLEITGVEALSDVRQRDRDAFAEAEGFADALPLGGGF